MFVAVLLYSGSLCLLLFCDFENTVGRNRCIFNFNGIWNEFCCCTMWYAFLSSSSFDVLCDLCVYVFFFFCFFLYLLPFLGIFNYIFSSLGLV